MGQGGTAPRHKGEKMNNVYANIADERGVSFTWECLRNGNYLVEMKFATRHVVIEMNPGQFEGFVVACEDVAAREG